MIRGGTTRDAIINTYNMLEELQEFDDMRCQGLFWIGFRCSSSGGIPSGASLYRNHLPSPVFLRNHICSLWKHQQKGWFSMRPVLYVNFMKTKVPMLRKPTIQMLDQMPHRFPKLSPLHHTALHLNVPLPSFLSLPLRDRERKRELRRL